jgi:hypothetical protein
MSHYYYNSAFDFVSNDGNFGYYIEESVIRDSSSDYVADEYIIEVHYLGEVASSLSIDVSSISGSDLDDIYYVEKGFSDQLRTNPDGEVQYDAVNGVATTTSDIIASGGTSWGLEQGSQDPAFGLIEIKIPTTTSDTDQIAANGIYRPHDYLHLEAGLYFDVIQSDTALVTSLQGLINGSVTLDTFAGDLATATDSLTEPKVSQSDFVAGMSITDASNDISQMTREVDDGQGNTFTIQDGIALNEIPHMIHFDNIDYYSYDDFSSPVPLNAGADIVPSETTLIGEFRIDEADGTDSSWSFDVDMEVYMNTNTLPSYDPVMVDDGMGNQININESFINDTTENTNVSTLRASISRDADGMLTITDKDHGTNTITEAYIFDTLTSNSTITFDDTAVYGGTSIAAGTYLIDPYVNSSNVIENVGLSALVESSDAGYYSVSDSNYISVTAAEANMFVSDINNNMYQIGNVELVFDGLGINWNTVDLTNSDLLYDNVNTIPDGNYLVNQNGPDDVTLTLIGEDTDYDGLHELDESSVYQLYVNRSGDSIYDEVEYMASYINQVTQSDVITYQSVLNADYETSETVITKMSELGDTWNSATIDGSFMDVDGQNITAGTYKVSSDSGHIYLQATTGPDNGEYDIADSTPYQLSNSSQTDFEEAINMGSNGADAMHEDLTYKQYFYDLIDTETHDGKEVIDFMEMYVSAEEGTTYQDAQSFINSGMNFINTAVVYAENGVSSVDAGDGYDLIAGGVGGITVDGGSGVDLYFASPANIEIKTDQNGNVISEDGVVVDLTSSKVFYYESGTEDTVENVEYFMGTLGDDKFIGSSRYGSPADTDHNKIQVFNPTKGKDEIFGAETEINPNDPNGVPIDVLTAVDYDGMQGGQGVIFILDGSDAASHADMGQGEISYEKISEFAGEYWEATSWAGDGWLPSNEDIVNESGNFSTVSRYQADKQGATLILDTFGDTDLAFDVDHYIGSGEADIFFGSAGDDSFDAATGTGNYMSGGDGQDQLIINDLNEKVINDNDTPLDPSDDSTEYAEDNIELNSIVIDRLYDHIHFHDVKVDSGTTKLITDTAGIESTGSLYRIDFADVSDLSAFYQSNLSDTIPNYSVSNDYQLFLRTSVADISASLTAGFAFDSANQKIDVTSGEDLSSLNNLTFGQLVIAEELIVAGAYTITGVETGGDQYNTVIENVEQVTLTSDDAHYFGTGQITGSQEDIYQLITGGQGDIGDMLYVETGEKLLSTTGAVDGYAAGSNFISGEIFYSGHHTDFDRNTNTVNTWANSVAIAYTDQAKIWNDEVAQFFVWYDADETDTIDGYEIAVKYQNGDVNAWGIDNRQFDTFQNVTVDQGLADAIKVQFGDSVSVKLGEYRVLYEAAFTDIETLIGSNADVNQWNFDFQPTSSRSTFYIQVGGDATGENGSSGISDTLVTNVKVERVDDGGSFKWVVNPQAEILVNLPILAGADESDNLMISGNSAETIEALSGADVMMGRGGSDNYKINAGDTLAADGTAAVGSYGVAGDVINEVGGSSEDKSDAITLSSAETIDQVSFSRVDIANEYWGNTLKIDVAYDSGVSDTLYVFDHYNQSQSFRAVEQLFLDDGWDANEIWNLVVGDMNESTKIDEYEGTYGQDVLIAGTKVSNLYGGDGKDIMIGDTLF